MYFRDKSPNEAGGFGITDSEDLLLVRDFVTVKQRVTSVSVKFDDPGVADFFDRQVDLGRRPEQFARLWCHSHPGMSPEPSGTDEETFRRVFGGCDWAGMMIVSTNRSAYCRLSFNVGPGGQVLIPVQIDYTVPFEGTDHKAWDAEYAANVKVSQDLLPSREGPTERVGCESDANDWPYDFVDEFQYLDPEERQMVLEELAEDPDLWNKEGEVILL